jgi:ubiquinone/menaquinone biosynthesis C-methylase UbiE
MRLALRKVYYLPSDFIRIMTGKRDNMVPLKGDIYTGSGDFTEQGKHHLELLKKLAGLKPEDTVLDVGSGIGRTAVALTSFLSSAGHYEGFDVVKKGVEWCINNISKKFPNFNFRFIPLKNDLYNNEIVSAEDFVFPYTDCKFDIVFLFSVFTHMQPGETDHYLHEIYRVLIPGGKCLATLFFFEEDTEEKISGNNTFGFPVKKDGYRLMNKNVTSANVAYEKDKILTMVAERGFEIIEVIPGYWKDISYKSDLSDFQDIVVIRKSLYLKK